MPEANFNSLRWEKIHVLLVGSLTSCPSLQGRQLEVLLQSRRVRAAPDAHRRHRASSVAGSGKRGLKNGFFVSKFLSGAATFFSDEYNSDRHIFYCLTQCNPPYPILGQDPLYVLGY